MRYLAIAHPEKTRYDLALPVAFALLGWGIYLLLQPRPPLFGDGGLLRYVRDMLVMAVPFMVGALAAVSMGAPGAYLDRRPDGIELCLDGRVLSMRQFTCYLLGYLSFLGIATLGVSVGADLVRPAVLALIGGNAAIIWAVRLAGSLTLSLLLSALTVTVFWALYFLTDVVNRSA